MGQIFLYLCKELMLGRVCDDNHMEAGVLMGN